MHQPVRGQRLTAIDLKWSAIEVADSSASFLHNQDAGRRVPGIEIEFPETVEASAGHIAQVESRRPGAAHAVRAQRDLVIEKNIGIFVPLMTGEAGGDQAFFQPRGLLHMDCLAVEMRAPSLLGREKLVARRIVDHSRNSLPFCSGF